MPTLSSLSVIHYLLSTAAIAHAETDGVSLVNPLGTSDVRVIIGYLIQGVLGLSGSIALVFFVWGGLIWLTSQGNADKIKQGRNTLTWATIGLAVIFSAYTLTNAVLSRILEVS